MNKGQSHIMRHREQFHIENVKGQELYEKAFKVLRLKGLCVAYFLIAINMLNEII